MNYNSENPDWIYLILHCVLSLIFVVIIEYLYQFRQYCNKNRPDAKLEAKPDVQEMTIDEFKSTHAAMKKNIVLLENNVIELKEWEVYHPGGKFVL